MKIRSILLAIAGLALSSTAHAAYVSYSLQWSGASFSNAATASAYMTVDDTVFNGNSSFFNSSASTVGIVFFELALNGTASYDGIYNLTNDIDIGSVGYVWGANSVDTSTEMVGQYGFNDFNVFFSSVAYGVAPNTFVTNYSLGEFGPTGDETLTLTSFAPIPEPSAFALLGLGALGLVARRRRSA